MTDQMILHPGEYFIELEFDRPVDPAILHKALTSMGFGVVVFDQSLPTIEVGAVSLAAALTTKAVAAPATMKTLSTTATVATLKAAAPVVTPVQSRYAAPAVVAVVAKPAPAAAPVISVVAKPPAAVSQLASVIQKSALDTSIKLADGGLPAALKPSAAVSAIQKQFETSATNTKPSVYGPVTAAPSKSERTGPAIATYETTSPVPSKGSSPVFPGDVPAAPPPPVKDAPFVPVANDPVYEPAPEGAYPQEYSPPSPASPASSDSLAPQYASDPSPEAQAPAPSPVPLAPSRLEPQRDPVVLRDLWTKWKEWGSPFASGPSVSGEGDDDPLRFRVLARLDRPIALDDRPGMRWLFVKALSIPFLSDLMFKANPHTLRQGALYELRFLSRAKSNRSRDSVKQELVDMGWKPIKLSAIKRNMTLPRRPASLTLWYGMAVWNHADSVIVNDDPFFFETVKEIRPQ